MTNERTAELIKALEELLDYVKDLRNVPIELVVNAVNALAKAKGDNENN